MKMINDDREGSPDVLSNCEAIFKYAETPAHYESNGKHRSDLTNKNTNRYYFTASLAARDIDTFHRYDRYRATKARNAALIKFMKNDVIREDIASGRVRRARKSRELSDAASVIRERCHSVTNVNRE